MDIFEVEVAKFALFKIFGVNPSYKHARQVFCLHTNYFAKYWELNYQFNVYINFEMQFS